MAIVAGVGGFLFLLVCVVGGARLLLLARRTRELPELVLGAGLFLLGGVATPIGAIAHVPGVSVGTASALLMIQGLLMVAGHAGFAQFTYRVFRPGQKWAGFLAAGIPSLMLLGMLAPVFEQPPYSVSVMTQAPGILVSQLGGLLAISWSAYESLSYAARVKRQLRIGLGDPVVHDRTRLWGIAMALAALLTVIGVGGPLIGVQVINSVLGAAVIASGGFAAASAIYLAFLPPQFYTRRILARGQGTV